MPIKKASVSLYGSSLLYYDSLNEVRTRVLALRGLRPRPLVDEAIYLQRGKYYHDKNFYASGILNCKFQSEEENSSCDLSLSALLEQVTPHVFMATAISQSAIYPSGSI